jgi:arsenite methyltransferase
MNKEQTKKIVREGYAKVAMRGGSCCGTADTAQQISRKIGYSEEELKTVPEGANLGLGCGNPLALASLKEGETVLDLGSGPGLDCFLAAAAVGKNGKVIGVDMTAEMIERARQSALKGNYTNVEFRLGEIENLPVADNSVDVVISNCVINLSPDKQRVFKEVYRVLKPGGRIMVSDIALSKLLPASLMDSIDAYVGCIAGAITKDDYMQTVKAAGFPDPCIVHELDVPVEEWANDPIVTSVAGRLGVSAEEAREILGSVSSIKVKAFKK